MPTGYGPDAPSRWAQGRVLAALVALVGLASVLEAAAPAGQWWSATYRYRQKLSLTAGATAIPTQYSMRLQFDHAGSRFPELLAVYHLLGDPAMRIG